MTLRKTAIARRAVWPQPPPVRGGRWIPVGIRGHFTLVDADLFDELNAHSWTLLKPKYGGSYAIRRIQADTPCGFTTTYLHHAVLKLPKGTLVDHRDGNTLDNRRKNLRAATYAQSSFNTKKQARKKSGQYKGAYCYVTRRGAVRWFSQIRANGVHARLGTFDTEKEAAMAYDAAVRRLHKHFGRLNFPRRGELSAI